MTVYSASTLTWYRLSRLNTASSRSASRFWRRVAFAASAGGGRCRLCIFFDTFKSAADGNPAIIASLSTLAKFLTALTPQTSTDCQKESRF